MSFAVVVDDSPANLAIYGRLVAAVDPAVTVVRFADPHQALDWLGGHTADLVVTDYMMPSMRGAELTRRIRDLADGNDVPVIVVTAYADKDFRLEAFGAGASDFVQSPIDHYEFKMRVRNLLKLGGHQRSIRARARTLERELRETEESRDQLLRDSRERLAQVIDTIPAMISATDTQGDCIFVNAYQAALIGDWMVARSAPQASARLDQQVLTSGRPLEGFEEDITLLNGEVRTFLTTKSPLREANGRVEGVLSMSLDISERKQAEARLAFQARHDHLTSLPNRSFLFDRLTGELAQSPWPADRILALHFIDLDRFKCINDGLGHYVGDRLLKAVAERLQDAVRGTDTVARLGGDEFAILQSDAACLDDVARLAERLNQLLLKPFRIDSRDIVISASIGVTTYPGDGAGPEELLRNADLAMYRIKTSGRNGFQFFAQDMVERARAEVQMQAALRVALTRGEFELHFQPQVDLCTGRIVGAEALIRWRREGIGLVCPGEFLPVAAESGLMSDIDDWVLGEACRQARRWQGHAGEGVRVSVNVAAVRARAGDLRGRVMRALEEADLPPALLELELTEGMLSEDAERAAEDLEALHGLGVRISIDDFGTGFSSLARLARLHVDRLKIDKSFVETLDDGNSLAIVRAVVSLGRALRIEVLAEGVETAEQFARVQTAGCDSVQGYFTGRPVSAPAFGTLLAREAKLVPLAGS
ncbi:MAG: EAL domain-containing protein [Rhodospirillales bacterium]|jgi:diguanylate cyclase (GGDEF)-like protein/PAS domain S-box-containing protein|nr:EAL domain-containing protein [Rhodospirillales bacterium]